jgi:hypothetical protein
VVRVVSLARDVLAGHGLPVAAVTDGLSVVVPGARRLRMILSDTPGVRAENSVQSQACGSNEPT